MEIIKNEYQIICKSSDSQGDFEFRIQNDCSQIQLETSIVDDRSDSVYADVNRIELKQMADAILFVLGASNVFEKANKWDALERKVSQFYETYENGELIYDGDLTDIGELAASAFGYL
ncbi:hypothetical protein [Chishuiella sp.]|uniref:hypothetical protein n=1 Tax=Chishuiella sp. TaxID=1969467 RepID=UPI0028A9671F|nr:hypothetical protein [Chishuiella sp.]